MKSLQRRFLNIQARFPNYSTFICFLEACKNQRFGKQAIHRWFLKLVLRSDYSNEDKKALLAGIHKASNPNETR